MTLKQTDLDAVRDVISSALSAHDDSQRTPIDDAQRSARQLEEDRNAWRHATQEEQAAYIVHARTMQAQKQASPRPAEWLARTRAAYPKLRPEPWEPGGQDWEDSVRAEAATAEIVARGEALRADLRAAGLWIERPSNKIATAPGTRERPAGWGPGLTTTREK